MGKRVKILKGKPGWSLSQIGPLSKWDFPPLPDIYVEIPEEVTLDFKGVDFVGGCPPGIVIKFEKAEIVNS